MNRLAIETTTDRLSVAASAPDGRIARRHATGARRHAGLLGPLALETLGDLGLDLTLVDELLIADGPGSFTGIRVGAAWAKAVVMARGIPLFAASTLLIRAARDAGSQAPKRVLGVGAAMRGEIFVAGYRVSSDRIEEVFAPTVLPAGAPLPFEFDPEQIRGDVGSVDLTQWPWASGVDEPKSPSGTNRAIAPPERFIGSPDGLPDAVTLLGLATKEGGVRRIEHPGLWEPCYGRPSEAQARWERVHGQSLADSARPA